MKLKLPIFFALFLSILFIYTACKKSNNKPTNSSALTPKTVTGQVALNLTQSLFGGLGAFDISHGLIALKTFAVHAKGKVFNTLTNPTCSSAIDTNLNYADTVNSNTASVAGNVKFGFTCANNIVSGYNNYDNLTIAFANAQLSFSYKVIENLTLLSLNPLDNNANLSVKGSLSSNGSYQNTTGTNGSGTEIFNYTLNSLIIDPNTGDIISGAASFNTQGSGPQGVWSYTGTITFFGNYMASVVIKGVTYNVNLQTGVVS